MIKRNTQQGNIILDVIKKAERPLTPIEIHQKAILKSPRIGIATTYRHLKVLSEGNQVVGVDYPGQPPRYEWADGKDKVHFSCRSCDKLIRVLTIQPEIYHPPTHPKVYAQFRDLKLCYTEGARSACDKTLEGIADTSICISCQGLDSPSTSSYSFIKNIIDSSMEN